MPRTISFAPVTAVYYNGSDSYIMYLFDGEAARKAFLAGVKKSRNSRCFTKVDEMSTRDIKVLKREGLKTITEAEVANAVALTLEEGGHYSDTLSEQGYVYYDTGDYIQDVER